MNIKTIGLMLLTSLIAAPSAMQAAEKPTFTKLNDLQRKGHLDRVSDNGQWAVGYAKSDLDPLGYSYPRLYDVKNKKMTWLYKSGEENTVAQMMGCDVTDDGKIVAGQYKGRPAIWKTDQSEWIFLPYSVSKKYPVGKASFITPDGKYAIGTVSTQDFFGETLVMWDLTGAEPKECTPSNLPKPISMFGTLQEIQQIRATDLSPDGKKFIGLVCFSYAGEAWTFVYDMEKMEWEGLGYDVTESGKGDKTKYTFTPKYEGYGYLEGGVFSPDGKSIVGPAYTTEETDAVYSLDMTSGKVSILGESHGMLFGGVDGNGVVYASSPSNTPIRNWSALVGKYWYDVKSLVKQVWGVDWQGEVSQDDYGLSGTFASASKDGKVLLAADYSNDPYDTYILELPESFAEVAPRVNLLDNYAIAPVNNAAFAILSEVKVMFERQIDVTGEFNAVQLLDENGNVIANSLSVSKDPGDARNLLMTFRNRRLDVGKKYTVVIPAGVCNVAGDAPRKNEEIRVTYTGRPQAPVAMTTVSPAAGTAITRINSQSNPVSITFDAEIAPVEKKAGGMYLYRIGENGSRELITALNGSISGRVLSVFPVMEQRLAKGSKYEVVVEANAVADISGADPNAEIVIAYEGSYVPEPSIGADIFFDDFDSGLSGEKWMLWDGDQLEPNDEMQSWGFTSELPWWTARDDNYSTDMAAVAHSMFASPGLSDDWLITNQLFINDDTAVLTFKSQSYKNTNDVLKVYVYATDDIITALTDKIMDNFRYKSDLVFEEVQKPGDNVDLLAGDWVENTIKLDKYAGKNIYIAFVNQNRNKSAIFIEDVAVTRDIKFSLINTTHETVVAQDEITVSGILNVSSKTDTYKGYTLRLLDGEGKEISTVSDPDVEMSNGYSTEFKFPQTLPLTVGKVNNYTIDIKVGDLTEQVNASVQDLAIQTTRKVVLEKMTGQGCPNCPLGILAIDYIEKDFPNLVLPLAYHCYTGDNFNTPKANSMNQFLGMNAAPSARINRGPIASPMKTLPDYSYVYKNNGLWYDYVAAELNSFAPADITITDAKFTDNNFNVDFDIKYALDMDNANVNVLLVITENELVGNQDNNLYMTENEVLGEWGKGGFYGNASNRYTFNEVVRTWEGTSMNGTGGFVPSTIRGGEVYSGTMSTPTINRILNPKNCEATVMLIDAETGLVLNADRKGFILSGVEDILNEASQVNVKVEGGNVVVTAPEDVDVNVYGLDGSIISSAAGNGVVTCPTAGNTGVAIVMVKTENGIVTHKVMLR
ncbi:MAG: Ig-like domain-containing protein [Muribaculaceae bacterium]|nr:Ig-like domain-containing protein [Muribaculaceae bacterium]